MKRHLVRTASRLLATTAMLALGAGCGRGDDRANRDGHAPDLSLVPASETHAALDGPAPSDAVVAEAEQLITTFRGFEGTEVAAYHPAYDPAGNIDFWEAEITRDGEQRGYVMLGATRKNYPLVEFSPAGSSHYAWFRERVRGPFHMMRFGSGYIAAVSEGGEILAEVGERPRLLPPECQARASAEERVEDGVKLVSRPGALSERPAWCAQIGRAGIRDLMASYGHFAPGREAQADVDEKWRQADARVEERRRSVGVGGPKRHRSNWTDGNWNYSFAQGYDYDVALNHCELKQNITYYRQIPPNDGMNQHSYYSGCGPTAWLNYAGWWDLHGFPGTLKGAYQKNDGAKFEYINDRTMYLNWLLNVHDNFGEGATYDTDVSNGYQFFTAASTPSSSVGPWYELSYWYSYELWPYTGDHTSTYPVARNAITTKHVPLIVDYSSDSHITVAYGLAESVPDGWQSNSWLWINPAWGLDECSSTPGKGSKWINKTDAYGYFSITGMSVVRDAGFESSNDTSAAPGWPADPNGWTASGSAATFQIEHALGTAASGSNDARIVLDKAGPAGWQTISQQVWVEPYRHYRLSARVQANGLPASSYGMLGVKDDQPSLLTFNEYAYFGALPSWTTVSVDFVAPPSGFIDVYAQIWSTGTPYPSRWARFDDIRVQLTDNIQDGDFEMQPGGPSQAVVFPWERKLDCDGMSPCIGQGGVSDQQPGAYSWYKFAWLYNNSCAFCTGSATPIPGDDRWSEISQVISVQPHTTYRVSAYVNVNYTTLTIGVDDLNRRYAPFIDGVSAAYQYYPQVTGLGWQQVTFDFDSGSNDSLKLYFGYDPPPNQAWMWIDQVSVQPL